VAALLHDISKEYSEAEHFLVAEKHNIVYIDVFSKLLKDDAINMQYSYDGLHLNKHGYEILSYELKRYLE
jgi:lysophospholipase L1-like esterase